MKQSIKSSVIEVTPKLAAQWLELNKGNRPLNPTTVARYVYQILEGAWQVTGDAIKFNTRGELIDGQHRLKAVVEAKKPIKTCVTRGVDPSAFQVLDVGRTRTLHDLLSISGHTRVSYAYSAGVAWAYRLTHDPTMTAKGKYVATNASFIAFAKEHQAALERSVQFGRHARAIIRSEGLGIALHFIFRQKDVELADAFILNLGEGAGLTAQHPTYLLREILIQNATTKRKLPRRDVLARIIKTWNLLRQGKHTTTRQAIAWNETNELFPTIQ